MRHVTVYTTDKEYNHFVELTKSLNYVKKIETDEDSKGTILDNIKTGLKEAVEEVKLIKAGKIIAKSLKELLEDVEKTSIFTIIDMAISKKRLTDTLSCALNIAK